MINLVITFLIIIIINTLLFFVIFKLHEKYREKVRNFIDNLKSRKDKAG